MSSDTSTKVSMALLRTLHRIQRQRTDISGQLRRFPRQITASEEMVVEMSTAATDAADRLKKARMAVDEKQLHLKGREDRIRDLRNKLNSAASNREYNLLKEQIAADEQANGVLSDEIFEGLERLDVLEAERLTRIQEWKQREVDHQALAAALSEKIATCEAELKRVEEELLRAEAELPSAIKADYDRIVGLRGEEGLAPVEGEICGGCNQTLTTQMMNRLYLAQAVRCPSCGAMMYLAEDRKLR